MKTLGFKFATSLLLTAGLSWGVAAQAQDMEAALAALDAALPGELIHNPLEMNWEPGGNDIKSKIVDAPELTTGSAISTKIKKRQSRPWDTYLRVTLEDGVKKGEEIQVFYYVRTAKAAKGQDTAKIVMYIGRNEEPYDNILAEEILPSSEWKMASLSAVSKADYPAGELKIEYQLGKASQTVEFGPVYVSSLGMK